MVSEYYGLLLMSVAITGMSPMAEQRLYLPSATLNTSEHGLTLVNRAMELVQFAVHPESTGARNIGCKSGSGSDLMDGGVSRELIWSTLKA